ncbi:hypothetical protein [Chondromyces crocatus]|uniref:Uncharacterized protein n=1 Tax=Chondromyces crocatus TaxID=52 RepID=A0A0K1ES26_CHOCO|nr:hypothetical protein [Chondromyces crocatus]AKT43730.1 uncharacterized protein CMC5_079650 [Chondromyces crocatus]
MRPDAAISASTPSGLFRRLTPLTWVYAASVVLRLFYELGKIDGPPGVQRAFASVRGPSRFAMAAFRVQLIPIFGLMLAPCLWCAFTVRVDWTQAALER